MADDAKQKTDTIELQPLLLQDVDSKETHSSTIDKVWPYLVLTGGMLSDALGSGFNLGIAGALTVAQSQRFGISLDQASWSTSIHTFFYLMTNPIAAILTRILSTRKVQLLGFITALIGICCCGFATNHLQVVLSFGIVSGTGFSLIRATMFGILPYHFEKQHLYMATAVLYAGHCAGWLIIPAPSSYMFTKYGFNNTMFMMAPLMSVHLLGVAFFSQTGESVRKENTPNEVPLRETLKLVFFDGQVHLYMLSALARKFGQAGFFTIYQDYAIHNAGLTLTQSGFGGTIYGSTAIIAVVLVMLSHALKMQYNIAAHLTISALLNGVAIMMMVSASSQMTYYLFIAFLGFWHGSFLGNIMNLGSNLAGAKNLVLIQSFEALGNGLGGFVGPPVTSYLQEKISAKFGMYASGVSLIAAAGITALIGFMRHNKSKTEKIQQPGQKPISEHTESH